jgi:HEPN domain-containing protein
MMRTAVPWIRKAENDFLFAKSAKLSPHTYDAVCFHCQQSVEKYIKALMVEANLAFPKTHDLDRLLSLAVATYPSLQSYRRAMLFLSTFAVETRYPGFDARRRQAVAALRWAEQIRQECRTLLGLKPPRRKGP